MVRDKSFALKIGTAIAFLFAMVATYYYHMDDAKLFLVAFFSCLIIGFTDRKDRLLYPVLLIFLGIRLLEVLFTILFIEVLGLTYLLMSGLLELFFAFLLVHYHQDSSLRSFFKINLRLEELPQIHWIAIILGICCFYRVAAAVELMIHEIDSSFFQGEIPFFFSTGPTAMLIMRLAIDTLLWSMLLFPRKLAHFRVTPPPQATPD